MSQPLPLSAWAQERLDNLAKLAGCELGVSADALMRERALINGHRIGGLVAPGGGCSFYRAKESWVALNLAREDDHALLPALFCTEDFGSLGTAIADRAEAELVAQGRLLGLAIAGLNEASVSPALEVMTQGRTGTPRPVPKVLDLSALWAGPLATQLLRQAGCEVTRVESTGREDPLPHSDPAHFAALQEGKRDVKLDLRSANGREKLHSIIAQSDIVIEAARPRALLQLGIDADALVRAQPGLTWLTITGHGAKGDSAEWVGFGDDTAVAAGLSRELHEASGQIGFVGDAIGDPLTGIAAAEAAMHRHLAGRGARLILSMSGVAGEAIAAEKRRGAAAWRASLKDWAARTGMTFTLPEREAA